MKWTLAAFLLAAAAPGVTLAATSAVSAQNGASTYTATSALAPTVRDLNPSPGDTVKAFFPRFTATIDTHGRAPLRRQSLRLYVDGTNVTSMASFDGNTIAYSPRAHLQAGWHDAFLEASDTQNHAFGAAWVFRSEDPDIDTPLAGDGGFAFVPVGDGGPFTHVFLISPFDGFGDLQLCGGEFPLLRAGFSPVFFVTVPVTFGTVLAGCSPGLFFTPFAPGLGQLNPVFFPFEIAGPGIFQHPGFPHRRHPMITGMPVYRTAPAMSAYPNVPVIRGGYTNAPVVRGYPAVPAVRGYPNVPVMRGAMPLGRAPALPGMRINFPPAAGAPIVPAVRVPIPHVPH